MRLTIFQPENWREIAATLSRNKTRTFLTAFGIFWGTAMLALLVGGADGLKGIMSRNFAGFATNMGGMGSSTRSISYMGFNKGSYWWLTTEDIDDIRRIAPAIEYSTAMNGRSVTGVYSTRSKAAQAMGVEAQYADIMLPVIYEGRFINDRDYQENRKVVVVGRNIATELFGSESPIGKTLSLNGVYFTCIGVAGQLSEASIMGRIDDNYILPGSTLRHAFNQGNNVNFFIYTAPKGHKPSENEPAIRRFLSGRHSIHPDDERAFWFMDMSEMFEMINGLFMGIAILAAFVGMGSLMAGVIGVGNIMWIIVKERTHEFGVRRAIGAKPADITVQVLSESVLLTLVAGTAGVCFAAIILGLADHLTADPMLGKAGFEISFGGALAIVGTFFILGSAAGTLPAIKAMRIKPIEALRDK